MLDHTIEASLGHNMIFLWELFKIFLKISISLEYGQMSGGYLLRVLFFNIMVKKSYQPTYFQPWEL